MTGRHCFIRTLCPHAVPCAQLTVARDTQSRLLAAWMVPSLPAHDVEAGLQLQDDPESLEELRGTLATIGPLRVIELHVSAIHLSLPRAAIVRGTSLGCSVLCCHRGSCSGVAEG